MARRASSAVRMQKQWSAIPAVAFDMTADGTFAGGALGFSAPGTALRIMGEYLFFPTSAPEAGDEITVTVAIGVVSSDAYAAGAGSLPDPTSEPEYPWLYWRDHPWGTASTSLALGDPFTTRCTFDVRSMRKLKPRESLVMVVQYGNVGTGGSPPMTFVAGATRVLVAT